LIQINFLQIVSDYVFSPTLSLVTGPPALRGETFMKRFVAALVFALMASVADA
jgi:hypothetical protein